jgi:hypothetical protein
MSTLPSARDSPLATAGVAAGEFESLHAEPDAAATSDASDFLKKKFLPCIERDNSVAAASVRVFGDLIDAACVEVAYECIRLKSIGAFSSVDHLTTAPTKLPAVTCPNCGASVGISKFVPHLSTCMNIGGRRRARPTVSTATSSRDGHISPSEFDFGSDDDDTAFGSRKRKGFPSSKPKNGETKTYGSKGKSKPIASSYASETSSNIMSDPFEFL